MKEEEEEGEEEFKIREGDGTGKMMRCADAVVFLLILVWLVF